jgi:dCMP deaminase
MDDEIKNIVDNYTKLPDAKKIPAFFSMLDSIEERLSWDEYFMLISWVVKQRSSCDRLNVGCVITKNNRVLCTGYNGHIPGAPHTSKVVNGHEQMTIHAEINAICHAANDGIRLNKSKVYVTHYPCINCAKSLIAAGVEEVSYLCDYKNDPIVAELFLSKGITVNKIPFNY